MRRAVWMLSDVIDEMLPSVELPADELAKLKAAVRTARQTI